MTNRIHIQEELKALNSQLADHQPSTTYQVPEGYFDGLVQSVMRRIRALETSHPAAELEQLSPYLAALSKTNPYTVPAGYFEQIAGNLEQATDSEDAFSPLLAGMNQTNPYQVPAGYFEQLAERMTSTVLADQQQSAAAETAGLSPLLSGLNKQMPFEVPAGYFDQLAPSVAAKESATEAKVISLTSRRWFRYAAAAMVTGVLFLAGLLIWNNQEAKKQSGIKVLSKVSKDIKPLNETQQDDLVDFLDAGMTGTETAQVSPENKSKEIQELLQDVSDEELKDFQEQSEDVREVLMTN